MFARKSSVLVSLANRLRLKIAVVAILLLVSLTIGAAWDARVWTWERPGDAALYLNRLDERDPLVEELRVGGIRGGDDFERLIDRAEPDVVHRKYLTWTPDHDAVLAMTATRPQNAKDCSEYSCAYYHLPDCTQVWIAARDGKLVYAYALRCYSPRGGHCLWSKSFMNHLNRLERQTLALWLTGTN